MQRSESLQSLLSRYCHEDEQDLVSCKRIHDFVRNYPNCFERSLLIGHITGSAWIVNSTGTHTLLTHHRKLNRWLQLGGHCDGDSNVLSVAMREAHEESGLPNIVPVSGEIFDLDIHEIPARGAEPSHLHYDIRFALQADESGNLLISEESNNLAWVEIERLAEFSTEESIQRMSRKWKKRAVNKSEPTVMT